MPCIPPDRTERTERGFTTSATNSGTENKMAYLILEFDDGPFADMSVMQGVPQS
jgi:hypothetical protein